MSSRAERLLPGLWQLRGTTSARWLRGDLLAGMTVAAYLVPQVMAYAEVAGLPAVAGLWAVVAPLTLYALLGTSRQLSVGPESSTALMTAAAVGALVASGNPTLRRDRCGPGHGGRRGLPARLGGPAWVPGHLVVPTGADRVHGRNRRLDDRQPARQDHRHPDERGRPLSPRCGGPRPISTRSTSPP